MLKAVLPLSVPSRSIDDFAGVMTRRWVAAWCSWNRPFARVLVALVSVGETATFSRRTPSFGLTRPWTQ